MEPLEPPPGATSSGARRCRLLALLAIVAFASRSGLGHASHAQPTPGYVSYAFTAFLIVFVLAIPVAIWRLPGAGARRERQAKKLPARA